MKQHIFIVFLTTLLFSTFVGCDQEPTTIQNKTANAHTSRQMPDVIIEASADLMSVYDEDINYLKRQPNAEMAVLALEHIKQLFLDNDFVLDTPELIDEYNQTIKRYADCLRNQPSNVRDKMNEY